MRIGDSSLQPVAPSTPRKKAAVPDAQSASAGDRVELSSLTSAAPRSQAVEALYDAGNFRPDPVATARAMIHLALIPE